MKNFAKLSMCFLLLQPGMVYGANAKNKHISSVYYESYSKNSIERNLVVRGTVLDETGEPVIGASVFIKGTTQGTVTDFDGNFEIQNVDPKYKTVVVSFIGYSPAEAQIQKNKRIIVSLKENSELLEEVVVVGYGVQKKESVVGAISQVNNESITKAGTSDITSALAGKLSGVTTMQQSGQPGSTSNDIMIRGVSSWNGNKPLVLVDGVERDFNAIDPNEVKNISVLKDASATAVFGAKGANGVIIVTTNRGTEGKPKLSASASYGFQTPSRMPEHIDAYTTMSLYNIARKNSGSFSKMKSDYVLSEYKNPSSRLNSLLYPDVNWFDLVSRNFASTTNVNVGLSGGTKFVKYYASLGYTHEGSLFNSYNEGFCDTRFKYDRLNYRMNLDFDITNRTVLSFNLGGIISTRNAPTNPGNIWEGIYQASTAMYPAYYPSWVLEEIPDTDYPDASGTRLSATADGEDNPYTLLNQGKFSRTSSSTLYTDLILKQDLGFITKGLSFNGKVSLSTYYNNEVLKANKAIPIYELRFGNIGSGINPWFRQGQTGDEVYVDPTLDINVGGLQNGYYTNLYYEFSVNYNRTFGDHSVSALLLMNRQNKNTNTEFAYRNEAWVARATYDYRHRYLFEMNLGYTGSERFAPSNRFGFFPSFALGWVMSEEKWFKENVKWVSKLKFRYSDGKVGSDTASERWLYMSEYKKDGNYIYEGKIANATAQWEEARKKDFGIEIGLFDNMITLGMDLFDEQRTKMLLTPRSNTPLIGNSGFKQLNLGAMKKHGIEIEAGFKKKTSYGLGYNINAMISLNENRIIEKDDLPFAPEYKKDAGKAYGGEFQGSITTGNGHFNTIDDIHNYPTSSAIENMIPGDYRYLDYTADGKITDLDKYPIEGSLYPPCVYSFGGGLNYKNFSFNILFQGNVGKYVKYGEAFEIEYNGEAYRLHKSQLDYWTPLNHNANHNALRFIEGNAGNPLFGWAGGDTYHGYDIVLDGRSWRRADYLKLREIYIGYDFKNAAMKKTLGISNLTVYATGNNLLTFTKLVEGDPERRDFNKGFYPQMATYKLGMKLTF